MELKKFLNETVNKSDWFWQDVDRAVESIKEYAEISGKRITMKMIKKEVNDLFMDPTDKGDWTQYRKDYFEALYDEVAEKLM